MKMDNKPTKAMVHRILGALHRSKRKYVPLESLSRLVGIYPDVLADTLVYFEPMIRMDLTINTRDLEGAMEEYLKEPMKEKNSTIRVKKTEVLQYSSIADFVYKRMTSVGGLVDPSIQLDDKDLEILKRLIDKEVAKRKKASKSSKNR